MASKCNMRYLIGSGSKRKNHRNHYWDNWENLNMGCLLHNISVSMLFVKCDKDIVVCR